MEEAGLRSTHNNRSGVMKPEDIVNSMGLAKGDYVADFGPGHGYFTLLMARAVGADGKVFAVDIQRTMLDIIRAKAKLDSLLNIEYIRSDLEQTGASRIQDNYTDLVLIGNALFQAEKKENMIVEARRILRADGHLAIIEWDPNQVSPLGPPADMRMSKRTVTELATTQGFTMLKEFDAGAYHYGLMFRKQI